MTALRARLARVAGHLARIFATCYPASMAAHADEIRTFVDQAIAEAEAGESGSGLVRLLITLARDVLASRWRGAALDITDGNGALPGAPPRGARSSRMSQILQDVRYAMRRLARTPGFTAVALITLALGIGMTTAVFTVVDESMLRPFSYPDIDRMVVLTEANQQGQGMSVAWPNFEDWRAGSGDVFDELGVYRGAVVNLTGQGDPERLNGSLVSASVFATAGVRPLLGRAFDDDDDRPGSGRVMVMSERLWRSHFGAAPDIVGRILTLNGQPVTVAGVMPAAMRFPSRLTDVWLSLGPVVDTFPKSRGDHPGLTAVGRLKPGVTIDRARATLTTIADRLSTQYPNTNHGARVVVSAYRELVLQDVRPAFRLLLGAVGLVLLIACANLANLMLARTEASHRELAIRAALGAGRRRLAQQLLIEALVLSFTGGVAGVLLAYLAVAAFVGTHPTTIPRIDLISVDGRVLAFALATSVLTGLLFGGAPALRSSIGDLQRVLRAGRDGLAIGARRMRSVLVTVEIAVALMLLVGAGLLARSLVHLTSVDLGFDPSHLVTMQMTLPVSANRSPETWVAFHRTFLAQLSGTAGLDAVGLSTSLPLSGNASESMLVKEGGPLPTPGGPPPAECVFQVISPDYFRTMSIAMIGGRGFDSRDAAQATPVVIVDDTLVDKFFPDHHPIGQRISFEAHGDSPETFRPIWREIVGVVHHVKQYGLTGEPPYFQVFVPYEQLPLWMQERRPAMSIVARTTAAPDSVIASVRQAVRAIAPDVPVYGVSTMDQTVSETIEQPRLSLALFSAFATLALVLAVVGIYGVLSYSVAQRTREIGVRMALGARRSQIAQLVARQAATLVGVGLVLGVIGALALSRLLTTLLFDVSPTDPVTIGVVVTVLATTAGVATAIPARRASSVDPQVALLND